MIYLRLVLFSTHSRMGDRCQASAADAPSLESTAEDLDGREYSCGVIAFFWATWITWTWTELGWKGRKKDGKRMEKS